MQAENQLPETLAANSDQITAGSERRSTSDIRVPATEKEPASHSSFTNTGSGCLSPTLGNPSKCLDAGVLTNPPITRYAVGPARPSVWSSSAM
jgi:hypothetical protein